MPNVGNDVILAVKKYSRTKNCARIVMLVLADAANNSDGYCFVNIATLCDYCNADRSSIMRGIDQAEKAGELVVCRVSGTGSRYIVTVGFSEETIHASIKYNFGIEWFNQWQNASGGRLQPVAKCNLPPRGKRERVVRGCKTQHHQSQIATTPVATCDHTRGNMRPQEPLREPIGEPSMKERAKRSPNVPPKDVQIDDWQQACECADLLEALNAGVDIAGLGGTLRAHAFASLADWLAGKSRPVWEQITPTMRALHAVGVADDGLRTIVQDLHRNPDRVYPKPKVGGGHYSRFEQLQRTLRRLGERDASIGTVLAEVGFVQIFAKHVREWTGGGGHEFQNRREGRPSVTHGK